MWTPFKKMDNCTSKTEWVICTYIPVETMATAAQCEESHMIDQVKNKGLKRVTYWFGSTTHELECVATPAHFKLFGPKYLVGVYI